MDLQSFTAAIAERGWACTRPILDDVAIATLCNVVAPLAADGRGGARNLLAHHEIRRLAASPVTRAFARAVLGDSCFAVRALLFDKTPLANWKVVWHQDLTITTRERVDTPGFGPWTEKAGVAHVQPPVAVLEKMLAIRVHLDNCGADNGPVRVIEGSHRLGRLSTPAIDELRRLGSERDCLVDQGALLAFRPLILHASAPAQAPTHSRVIHIEYAAEALPQPLEWHQRVA